MIRNNKNQEGFTTVELMISLIVAALFIVSGLQFYGSVSLRAQNTRQMAEASNLTYKALRKEAKYWSYAVSYPRFCNSPLGPHVQNLPNSVLNQFKSPILKNQDLKVHICRVGADSDLMLITLVMRYGEEGPNREVRHGAYYKRRD